MARAQNDGIGKQALNAAVGVAAGMAIVQAKKFAAQAASTAMAAGWFEAIKAEHKTIRGNLEKLLATDEKDVIGRTRLLKALERTLGKHAFEEENVIYPALRLSGRPQDAHGLEHDHADGRAFLYELSITAYDHPKWIERARAFEADVQKHFLEEEREIFPAFHAQMSKSKNQRLSRMLHMQGMKLA
ncbi:MAG: hemerythrin domain-containing protein [Pseudomonadota bacterium]